MEGIQVKWVNHTTSISVDITNKVISYVREQNICSGIGSLTLVLAKDVSPVFETWDRIVLWENTRKKGTYHITEITKNTRGELHLVTQDNSKRLTDTFITEIYYIDYPSYAGYWIAKFCDEAGVAYTFETDPNGALVSENTSLGPGSAYEIIQTLLQQSGWYMYFDSGGHCHIGSLALNTGTNRRTVNDHILLSLKTHKDDKMLRNRAVVWGNADDDGQVFADVTRPSPYLTSPQDVRTVVLANSNIRSSAVAATLADRILDEFNRLTFVKELEVAGERNIEIGDIVKCNSKYWTGEGLVTTIGSNATSSGGLHTRVVLDERCPRLFGYYGFEDWVYIGTDGVGVWRKLLDDDQWSAFSAGLDDYVVYDLMIKNGVFACVAGDHSYINLEINAADWRVFTPPILYSIDGIGYQPAQLKAIACDIDDTTNHVYFGYRLIDSLAISLTEQRSWVVEVMPNGDYVASSPVYYTDRDYQDFKLVDVERHGENSKPTAEAPANYAPPDVLFGMRRSYPEPVPCLTANTFGPLPDDDVYADAILYVDSQFGVECGMDIEGKSIAIVHDSPDRFKYFTFDKDDNIFKAVRQYVWPVTYYVGAHDRLQLLDRIVFRDGTQAEGGSEDEDINRYYNVVDVVKSVTNDYETDSLYLYQYRISPLIARPIYHNSVHAASTGNIDLSPLVIKSMVMDGVALSAGMRVLLKDQTDPRENGIYYVMSNLIWFRDVDADQAAEMIRGLFVNVSGGTTNIYKAFQLDIPEDVTVVIGLTEFTFTEVLILTVVGAALVLDAQQTFLKGYSQSDFPKSVQLVNGTIYILMIGDNPETGEIGGSGLPYFRDAYMAVYGMGGFTVGRLDRTELRPIGSEYPLRSLLNEQMVACGTGVAFVRTNSYTNIPGMGSGSDGSVTFERFLVEGTDVNFSNKVLVQNSDSSKGDWSTPPGNPVHGASAELAQIKHIGSKLDNGVSPYFAFKASANGFGMWTCCFTGDCDPFGGLKIIFDRSELFRFGVIDAKTCDYVYEQLYDRGVINVGCSESPYDNYDYDQYNFNFNAIFGTTNRGQTVRFIYNGNEVWDGFSMTKLGDLTNVGGTIATHLDDFDGSIYVVKPGVLYKESSGGGQIAEIRQLLDQFGTPASVFGGNGSLIVTNGLIISHNVWPGAAGGYTLHLFKDEYLFKDQTFCYLLDDDPDLGFDIKDFEFYSFRTEEDKGDPLMSITIPSGLVHYTFGGTDYTGIAPEHLDIYTEFYHKTTVSGLFNDIRSFDLASDLILASGITLDTPRGKYIGVTRRDSKEFAITPYSDPGNWQLVYQTENPTGKLETSNYYYPPYFFVSASGGVIPEFFQKNPYQAEFLNYSDTLPLVDVTIIRADDRM